MRPTVSPTPNSNAASSAPAPSNLTLYETRIDRMIVKNKRELDELQAKSKAEEAAARDEAEKLLRLELRKAKTVDKTDKLQVNGPTQSGLIPTPVLALDKIEVNGFVFSTSALLATMNRKDTREEAKFYDTHGWNNPQSWSGPAQTLPLAA